MSAEAAFTVPLVISTSIASKLLKIDVTLSLNSYVLRMAIVIRPENK